MHGNPIQGETVNLGLVSSSAGAAAVLVGIFDANGLSRPLLSTERLLIDTLQGNVSAGIADVTAGSTAVVSSTIIASFTVNQGLDITAKEGWSLPVGVSAYVTASTSTASLRVTGQGRVINGIMPGVQIGAPNKGAGRANWRELTSAGGNF